MKNQDSVSKDDAIRVRVHPEVHSFLYDHLLNNVPSRKKWADAILILASIGLTASRIGMERHRTYEGTTSEASADPGFTPTSNGLRDSSGPAHDLARPSGRSRSHESTSAGLTGTGNTIAVAPGHSDIKLAPDDVAEMGALFSN